MDPAEGAWQLLPKSDERGSLFRAACERVEVHLACPQRPREETLGRTAVFDKQVPQVASGTCLCMIQKKAVDKATSFRRFGNSTTAKSLLAAWPRAAGTACGRMRSGGSKETITQVPLFLAGTVLVTGQTQQKTLHGKPPLRTRWPRSHIAGGSCGRKPRWCSPSEGSAPRAVETESRVNLLGLFTCKPARI